MMPEPPPEPTALGAFSSVVALPFTRPPEMANLSPSYFWALFKQKTGYAPVDSPMLLRMHQGCHLFKCTNMPVN